MFAKNWLQLEFNDIRRPVFHLVFPPLMTMMDVFKKKTLKIMTVLSA